MKQTGKSPTGRMRGPIKIIVVQPDQPSSTQDSQTVTRDTEAEGLLQLCGEGNLNEALVQLVLLGKETEVLLAQNDALQTALSHQREALLQLHHQQQACTHELDTIRDFAQHATQCLQQESQPKKPNKCSSASLTLHSKGTKHSPANPVLPSPGRQQLVMPPPDVSANCSSLLDMLTTSSPTRRDSAQPPSRKILYAQKAGYSLLKRRKPYVPQPTGAKTHHGGKSSVCPPVIKYKVVKGRA